MIRQRMTIQFAILFLLLGTSMAWSKRQHKPKESVVVEGSQDSAESKISPRYSDSSKGSHGYILHEDDHKDHGGNGQAEEYLDSEDQVSHKEQEEAVGNEELDKNVKDDRYNDHSVKGAHQRFEAGGASFDKHLKDHKADNKEIENVKQHDVGEKFGGQATKEHKLGKNKEKSKGHKLHGFKNVYHKEEYGDHKTFHDEFLDSDHQHNYDDHHEHQEMEGGKFSKGFKHEGKNKKYDKGDEKREWGKEEYDGQHEGKHEKGGQSSKHRHGSKKHQGHYDANVQRNKNSVHKIKKGTPPPYVPHAGHHGPHQAQIQPYVHQYNSQHEHVPSHQHKPQTHSQSHHVQYDDDKYKSTEDNGGHYQNHENHPSSHGSHKHNHGGHNDHDQSQHYSQDDDDHESDYQERTHQNHRHRSQAKEQLEDKSDAKISQRQEPVAHKQSVSSHYGTHQYRQPVYQEKQPVYQERQPVNQERQPVIQERQPVYQEKSHFKQPEYSRQEKFSHPFNERSHNHDHRIRYGYQPRNHHHHSHHQHQQQQQQQQLQPFPRFPGFNHHHGHHHHGHHKSHFRPMTSHYHQESTPDVHARKTEHASIKPSNEDHRRIPHKHYE